MPVKSFDALFDTMMTGANVKQACREEMDRLALGSTINHARTETGISLDKLSAKSGVTKSTLLRIEHSRTTLSLATVSKIAAALDKRIKITLI